MSVTGSLFFDEICRRGSLHEADVAKLRELYYEDGLIDSREADALFEVHAVCRIKDPAWQDFFVEAICDYLVAHAEPRGYINIDNADWLLERITHDGVLETRTELEILIRAIDKARWSPESMVRFALHSVNDAVISGKDTLRGVPSAKAGQVTDADVDLIRRIIFAFGGDGNVAVTRAEAEILFAINDATAEQTDNAAWTELFVKAIAGVVMAASGYSAPPRAEALRREQWLESRGDLAPGNFVSAMLAGGLSGFKDLFSRQNDEERELARLDNERRAIITAEEVTGDEAEWLAAQIDRDGALTYNERCLLEYLKAESPQLHPALQPLLERAAEQV